MLRVQELSMTADGLCFLCRKKLPKGTMSIRIRWSPKTVNDRNPMPNISVGLFHLICAEAQLEDIQIVKPPLREQADPGA